MGLLTSIFGALNRRSLENPSTPLSAPDDWLFDSLGSFRASSGVNVNRETALTYDAYWRCVSLLSGDVAKLPLCVYQRTPKGKAEDKTHPAYRLLQYEFSPEIDAHAGKRVLTLHALTEGNGYAYIVRRGDGRPLELWPLSPMKTYPVRENQRLWYVTEFGSNDSKQQRKLPAEDVFHLKGLSFDGLVGYAAISKMREALGLALAYENFGSIYFRNNARANVVLKHPGRLKPEAKTNLRESWERMHSGLENAHRTAILEEGMDIDVLSINARDSQLLEGKAFSRVQMANFFGVPQHKVGSTEAVSYNSLEQENDSYIEDGGGLGHWLPAWTVEAWRKLLAEEEKEELSHYFHFKTRHLRRGNLATRTAYYTAMVTNGILSPDEAREEEGYDPRDDGLGGKFLQPVNLQVAGQEPEPAPEPSGQNGQGDNKDEDDEQPPSKGGAKGAKVKPPKTKRDDLSPGLLAAHRDMVADAVRRMVRRISSQAQRAAARPGTFMDWLDNLVSDHGGIVRDAITPADRAAAALMGEAGARGAVADSLVRDLHGSLLDLAGRATPGDFLTQVAAWAVGREATLPAQIAAELLTRAVDEPTRSVAEALALLDGIPERRPGQILPLAPVNVQVPYTLTAEVLRDLWAADQVDTAKVRLRELVATQDWVDKEELRAHIQDLDRPTDALNVEGCPHDLATVVQCQDNLYIYDGHHRITARQLLRVAKSKVYLVTL